MSEALTRVIAEQQAEIDRLRKQLESANKDLNTVFTRHDELFEAFARLLAASVPDKNNAEAMAFYNRLRLECRIQMAEAGYCMWCHNFECECGSDE